MEPLEDRRLLSVALSWAGPGHALSLTEDTSGATPTITVSEPTPTVNQLKIDLGSGKFFASGSTTSATGLAYQNAGSPTTSQYATIDISPLNNVSLLQATLPGDGLTLGPIRDTYAGVGAVNASAGTIEVIGIDTRSARGSVDLRATGNLTVDSGASILSGMGTISLAADVAADGTGDNGAGTLSIGAGATVASDNSASNAITLRGADVNIDTSANPAVVGGQRLVGTTPSATITAGTRPYGLTANPALGCVYAANYGSNDVSMINTTTNAVVATVHVDGGPRALACNPSGAYLYAAAYDSNFVSVINTATNAVVATAIVSFFPEQPSALACTPSGAYLYAANNRDSTVSVINTATNAVVTTVNLAIASNPSALACRPDGAYMYVANSGRCTVSEINTATNAVVATVNVGMWPSAMTCSPNGAYLYVANSGDNNVSVMNTATLAVVATVNVGSGPSALACSPDGAYVYVANSGSGTVSVINTTTNAVVATLTGLTSPQGLAFDGSGNLYVGDSGNNNVRKYTPSVVPGPAAGGVVIRSSSPSRPMSLGGTNSAVAGINLTDAELAQIGTTSAGTVTIGDSAQTGNITFTTATAATTAGAATVVLQSTSGPGQIIIDDAGTGTGLNGNGGLVSLTPGTGGITAPNSAAGVPLATQGFNATGLTFTPTLTFAPAPVMQLTLIDNTATPAAGNPIVGAFSNLPQGGTCSVNYLGTPYQFQVNYDGGDGNDLVLTTVATAVGTTVINTLDAGLGSLRQAIINANAATAPAIIAFNIPAADPGFVDDDATLQGGDPGKDVFVIKPLSPLPAINNPNYAIMIDGSTQASFGGDTNSFGPEIVLNGSLAGTSANGLNIYSANNTVEGLVIQQFAGSPSNMTTGIGVYLSGSAASGNVIEGNYIGANATGTAAAANRFGVYIYNAPNNTIGGTTEGARNVISGSSGNSAFTPSGVFINGSTASGNVIEGNYIGTNATGTAAMTNQFGVNPYGVNVVNASNNTIGGTTEGARNVISGNWGRVFASTDLRLQGTWSRATTSEPTPPARPPCATEWASTFVPALTNNTIGGTAAGAKCHLGKFVRCPNLLVYNFRERGRRQLHRH